MTIVPSFFIVMLASPVFNMMESPTVIVSFLSTLRSSSLVTAVARAPATLVDASFATVVAKLPPTVVDWFPPTVTERVPPTALVWYHQHSWSEPRQR